MEYISKVPRYRLVIRFADIDPHNLIRLVIVIEICPETILDFGNYSLPMLVTDTTEVDINKR